ncbi:hypothetical protein LTR85_007799 [Meristemomyces frigidus]|nr:hypothetical protein LTR85_007799 [Meristemomyces frigidus]
MFTSITTLVALVGSVSAGSILWDGRANAYESSAFLNDWSFSNEVGPYQYYIHGDGATKEYVKLGTAYKNPADSGSKQGFQVTIDNSSVWNDDGMLRTELIPQTTAAINSGKVYYHFSMQHTGTNPPSPYEEHQVCFFESHFTEMKYGLISGEDGTLDHALRWEVNSESQWNVTFSPNVWHNIAYEIDFDAGSVGFYHSTGADDLTLTVSPVSVTASSNGADWHLGVLRLASSTGRSDTAAEDWHFSGIYIESGDVTTSVSGPGSASGSSGSAVSIASTSSAAPSTSSKAASTSSQPVTTSTQPTSTLTATSSKAVPTTSKQATTSTAPTKYSISYGSFFFLANGIISCYCDDSYYASQILVIVGSCASINSQLNFASGLRQRDPDLHSFVRRRYVYRCLHRKPNISLTCGFK